MKKILFFIFILLNVSTAFADSPSCSSVINSRYPDFNGMPDYAVADTDNFFTSCTSNGGIVIFNASLAVSQGVPSNYYLCANSCSCPTGESLVTTVVGNRQLQSCAPSSSSSPSNTASSAPSCSSSQYYDTILKSCASLVDNALDCGSQSFALQQAGGFSCNQNQPDNTNCQVNIGVGSGAFVSNYSCTTVSPNSNSSSGSGTSSASGTSSGSGTSSASGTSSGSGTGNTQEFQNCELTFGVGNCSNTATPCPNFYKVNGQTFCVISGTGSSPSSGSNTSGGTGGSNASSGTATSQAGECDPTAKSYDECMGRNKTPTDAEAQSIKDDFKNAGDKALTDYMTAIQDDLDNAKNNGVSFKDSPSQLKQFLNSIIPQPRPCQNIPFTFYGVTKNLNCLWFEKFKTIFGWFLYIITAIYIFKLAMRPVPS